MNQNGIIGDSFGTELPVAEIQEQVLNEERGRARFSKSKEYKELKQRIEERIAFHKQFLPSGKAVMHSGGNSTLSRLGEQWIVANNVIVELQGVIDFYESAAETIKNSDV